MEKQKSIRTDKEIFVMGLSLIYAIGVTLFALLRYLNEEYKVAALDIVLASFAFYVFIYVWKTHTTEFSSLAIAILSVIGTMATIYMKGPGQVYWAYPSVALVFFLLPTRQAVIIWSISAVIIMFQLIDLPNIQIFKIGMTLLITSFFCHLFSSIMHEQHNKLRKLANQDVLTQVGNRRAFNHDTESLSGFSGIVSAILIDLDNFKQVNDYHGHAKGDKVLKEATQYINQFVEKQKCLYRIGGDEFAILCPNKDFNHTYQLAKTIHQAFLDSQINAEHGITLSLAVAQKEQDETVKEWLNRLDSALYKAKKSGRNKVVRAVRY